jgi:acetyl esterase/lipase
MVMSDGVPVALWDMIPPGSQSWTHTEQTGTSPGGDGEIVRNVVTPTLTAYLPDQPTDRAVVVCPGGAMHFLAIEHEGRSVAVLLAKAGIAAFVLKYRVVPTPADPEGFLRTLGNAFRSGTDTAWADVVPLAVADGERAIELVRGEGYHHVTMLGFSAGARISAEIILRGQRRRPPDAAALVYLPSVPDCTAEPDSPPLFVLAAADDPLGIAGSLALHGAWLAAGAPVELHLFAAGGHGFGTTTTGYPVDSWPTLLIAWLQSLVPGSSGEETREATSRTT